MSWNTIKHNVDLSSVGVPSGPGTLAEILLSARSRRALTSHLSDDGLKKLIKLAYYASQQSEEGRYPTCRFFSYRVADKDDELNTVAVFNPPIELDLAVVRRLAHIAPRERNALVITEDGDRLVVTRLMSLDSPRDVDQLGRPEYWTSLHQPIGLMITIDGPGALQVSESQVTLRLRPGRIEEAIPVESVPGVREWHRTLATELQRRVAEIVPAKKGRFGGNMFMLVGAVWSQVLSGCVAKGHGGAFIILDPEKSDGNVLFNYLLEKPDLGETIVKFWLASIEATDSMESRDLRLWLRRHNQFRKQIDVVSSLANVDGCVCLTPDLKVLGFGGEILVDETAADQSPLVLADAKTNTPQSCQDSRAFGGTRHRSAFRLCKKASNALAFVVSQDGDLSVFYSNDKYVYAFNSLGAWFTNADLE